MEAAVVWLFNKQIPVRSRKLSSPNQFVDTCGRANRIKRPVTKRVLPRSVPLVYRQTERKS